MQVTVGHRPLNWNNIIQLIILLPLMLFMISPAQAQVAVPAGTYIRIEAGTAFHQNVSFSDTDPGAANCDLCGAQFPSSIAGAFVAGGAFGYRIASNFRTDLSINYIGSATVSGHSTAAIPSTGSAKVDSLVGLFNGYIDLPPVSIFGPIRPYIDGGIGIAANQFDKTTGNSGAVGPFTLAGASRTNFAWAVGAGAGYPLAPHVTLDVAYRLMDIGALRTGPTLSFGGTSMQVTPSKTESAEAHVVTIGLRYEF